MQYKKIKEYLLKVISMMGRPFVVYHTKHVRDNSQMIDNNVYFFKEGNTNGELFIHMLLSPSTGGSLCGNWRTCVTI